MVTTREAPSGAALSITSHCDDRLDALVDPLRRLAGWTAKSWPGSDPDNLLQIGLDAAWRALPFYDSKRASLITFVYPRARGAMIEACARLAREPANDGEPRVDPTDERPSPEERLLMLEQQRRALARLKPLDRNLLYLCAIEGQPLRLAAAKVGLEYKTAWVRIQHAMRRLGNG